MSARMREKVTTDKNGRKGRWVTMKGRKLFIPIEERLMDFNERVSEALGLVEEAEGLGEARYAITGSGLQAPAEDILLQPMTVYYMGASDSPSHIVVTKVGNDFIEYTNHSLGYKKTRREQKWIAQDLISRGVKTWLKSGYAKYHPEQAKSLRNLLSGKSGKKVKLTDFQPMTAYIKPANPHPRASEGHPWSTQDATGKDLWRQAEKYGGVGENIKTGAMSVNGNGASIADLKKDKNFKVLKVLPGRHP